MGKRPGHSYRRFHTHVGKMVALSTVSMNNLGSFAPLETFLSVFSFYRAEASSSSLSSRERTIVAERGTREQRWKKSIVWKTSFGAVQRAEIERSREKEKLFLSADGNEVSFRRASRRHCNYKFRKLHARLSHGYSRWTFSRRVV